MKKCPFCAEEIQDEAIKCKHCGEMLNGRKENQVPKKTISQPGDYLCSCGTSIHSDAKSCDKCGQVIPLTQRKVRCKKCGALNPATHRICVTCKEETSGGKKERIIKNSAYGCLIFFIILLVILAVMGTFRDQGTSSQSVGNTQKSESTEVKEVAPSLIKNVLENDELNKAYKLNVTNVSVLDVTGGNGLYDVKVTVSSMATIGSRSIPQQTTSSYRLKKYSEDNKWHVEGEVQ